MINKMLRDLEQRHNIHNSQHDVIRKQHQPVWLTILLWLTLLLAVFAIYAVLSRHKPVTTSASMVSPGEPVSITTVDPAASVTAAAAATRTHCWAARITFAAWVRSIHGHWRAWMAVSRSGRPC